MHALTHARAHACQTHSFPLEDVTLRTCHGRAAWFGEVTFVAQSHPRHDRVANIFNGHRKHTTLRLVFYGVIMLRETQNGERDKFSPFAIFDLSRMLSW